MIQHTGNGVILSGTVTASANGKFVLVDGHDLAKQLVERFSPGENVAVISNLRITIEQTEEE